MSDIIDPKERPSQAAQQLIIELIRAEKTGALAGVSTKSTTESILASYNMIHEHFKKLS